MIGRRLGRTDVRRRRRERVLEPGSSAWRGGVVGVCSVGKTAGCTTVAAALAWLMEVEAGVETFVVEADESGGDLNSWWGLGAPRASAAMTGRIKSGMKIGDAARASAAARGVGLVSAVCTSSDGAGVEPMVRTWVQQSRRGRAGGGGAGGSLVVMDVGRWHKRQKSAERVDLCDLLVALVEPTVAGIDRACVALGMLRQRCGEVVVAQMGAKPYGVAVVAKELGCEVREITLDKRAARSVRFGDAKEGLAKSVTAESLRRLVAHVSGEPGDESDAGDAAPQAGAGAS